MTFKRIIIYVMMLFCLSTIITPVSMAKKGCCSQHGGVCGDKCCDGTPLSDKCK